MTYSFLLLVALIEMGVATGIIIEGFHVSAHKITSIAYRKTVNYRENAFQFFFNFVPKKPIKRSSTACVIYSFIIFSPPFICLVSHVAGKKIDVPHSGHTQCNATTIKCAHARASYLFVSRLASQRLQSVQRDAGIFCGNF